MTWHMSFQKTACRMPSGILKAVDTHPPFRSLLKHKAYLATWAIRNLKNAYQVETFMAHPIRRAIEEAMVTGCKSYVLSDDEDQEE